MTLLVDPAGRQEIDELEHRVQSQIEQSRAEKKGDHHIPHTRSSRKTSQRLQSPHHHRYHSRIHSPTLPQLAHHRPQIEQGNDHATTVETRQRTSVPKPPSSPRLRPLIITTTVTAPDDENTGRLTAQEVLGGRESAVMWNTGSISRVLRACCIVVRVLLPQNIDRINGLGRVEWLLPKC